MLRLVHFELNERTEKLKHLYLFYSCTSRNTNKNDALDGKHFVIFFLKVVCDASSRLILFGTWMFTYTRWEEVNPTLTVTYYYGIMTLMIGVNIWFCIKENEKVVSLRNVIGKVFYKNYAFRMFSFQKARSKQYFQELCLTASCQS